MYRTLTTFVFTTAVAVLLMFTPLALVNAGPDNPVPQIEDVKFIPIAPIPNAEGGGLATEGEFSTYLNSMFQLVLAVGATLAAIYIAIGGFEYIFSEATQSKHDGKERIQSALFGLAILLLVTIILYVINPDAICLKIFEEGGDTPTSRGRCTGL